MEESWNTPWKTLEAGRIMEHSLGETMGSLIYTFSGRIMEYFRG